jgi:atypical dual specificity phosphatase
LVDGFHWVLPSLLGGCAQPGLLGDLDEDITWLERQQVRALITLTENPLQLGSRDLPSALVNVHFPIDDMGIPLPRRAVGLCLQLREMLVQGSPVVFHCKAGLGRTGTMLACMLVTLDRTPEQALIEVRRVCRLYVQTSAQERFLDHFAEALYASRPPKVASSSGALLVGI